MPTTIKRHITQEMINQYGALNGDNDMLHYDRDYARARGFRETIAHGMMALGTIYEGAIGQYGPEACRHGYLRLKWVSPVFAGNDAIVTVDDDGTVDVCDATGRKLIVGTAHKAAKI